MRAFEDVFAALPPSPKPARSTTSSSGARGGGVLPPGATESRRNSRMPAPPEAHKSSGNFLTWDESAPPPPETSISGRVRAPKVRVAAGGCDSMAHVIPPPLRAQPDRRLYDTQSAGAGLLSVAEARSVFGGSAEAGSGSHNTAWVGGGLGIEGGGISQRRPHISDRRYADAGLITAWAGGNFAPAEAARDGARGGKAHVAPASAFGSRGYAHLGGSGE